MILQDIVDMANDIKRLRQAQDILRDIQWASHLCPHMLIPELLQRIDNYFEDK